ncbi:MAG TPA: HlyD family efflux transporter periplasmic adaptor subunit [Thermoanaerobaculia bacterium]|nr:HlyD family efflux transporter periplasmic adaptor subunit [Thermoanaerobaculia bacterium]
MTARARRATRFAAGGVVLVAVVLCLWLVAGRASATGDGEWAEVRRDDLVIGVPVTGTLSAVQSVLIGPPQIPEVWDYKIAFLAPEGAQVRQGQPVVGFDTSELEQTLQQKMAERDSADKELEKRQVNLEKGRQEDELRLAEAEARHRRASLKVKVPSELIARNELAQSRTDLALAEREIAYLKERLRLQAGTGQAEIGALVSRRDRAAARVREAEEAIARMTVTAPRDGTVIYSSPGRRGEKKKIGDSVWRGQSVLEIPDLKRMRAEGEIDEADAGRVAVGQRVTLRLDAHPDVIFSGRVRTLRGAVQTKSRNNPLKVVRLEIDLDETDPQRMRPGMRFLGTVEIERVPEVLVVPAEAVFTEADGPVVYRRTRWGSEEVRPGLGRRNDRLVEIRSGLAPGDRVALRNLSEDGASGGSS